MTQKVIDFPAKDNPAQMDKITKTIQDLADCLETEIRIESVTMMRVTFDGTQVELESLLRRLTGNSAKKTWKKKVKEPPSMPLPSMEASGSQKYDPMGS